MPVSAASSVVTKDSSFTPCGVYSRLESRAEITIVVFGFCSSLAQEPLGERERMKQPSRRRAPIRLGSEIRRDERGPQEKAENCYPSRAQSKHSGSAGFRVLIKNFHPAWREKVADDSESQVTHRGLDR